MTGVREQVAALGIGGAVAAGLTAAGLQHVLAGAPGDPAAVRYWLLGGLGVLLAPLVMWLPVRERTLLRHRQVFELYVLDVALLTALSRAAPFSWSLLSVLLYAVPPLAVARAAVHGTRAALLRTAACLGLLALLSPVVRTAQDAAAAAAWSGPRGQGLTQVVSAPGVSPGPYRMVAGGVRELLDYPVAARDRVPGEGDPLDPAAALGVLTVRSGTSDQCARLPVPVTVDSGGQMTAPGVELVTLHDPEHPLGHGLSACGAADDPDGYELHRDGLTLTVSGGPGAPPHGPGGGAGPANRTDDRAADAARRRLLRAEILSARPATNADLRERSGPLPHTVLEYLVG